MPPTAPLTSANVSTLNVVDDEDEDVPLSILKVRAQSEVGLSSLSSGPSQTCTDARSTTERASTGAPSKGSNRLNDVNAIIMPTSSSSGPLPKSSTMPRSLSAFSVFSNGEATSSRQLQTRSASSHATTTMNSTIDRPEGVTLSSLIEAEKARLQSDFPIVHTKSSTASSRPSESSYGTSLTTRSDTPTASSNRAKRSSTLFPGNITYLSPIGDRSSPRKTYQTPKSDSKNAILGNTGQSSRHSKTMSVPLVSTDASGMLSTASKDRHRAEARRSGMLPVQSSAQTPFIQNDNGVVPSGSSLSPQALQGMPPPPGVDPTLYASRK